MRVEPPEVRKVLVAAGTVEPVGFARSVVDVLDIVDEGYCQEVCRANDDR